MGSERAERFSDRLRRRPEIPIALVVLTALLIGVLFSTRDQDSAKGSFEVGEAPGATTTEVIPTFTYIVSPLLTTTTAPPTTLAPSLTTIGPGGTYPTYVPVTSYPTTTRYTPVTTYPRPTYTYPTYTYPTYTTTTTSTTTTTLAPTTSISDTTSSTTSSTSSTTPTSSTTTTTVPNERPTVLVIGTKDNLERRVALMKALYKDGYNPVGLLSDETTSDAVYYADGYASSTVQLFDALEVAEPKADWSDATAEEVPSNPPWSPDWEIYDYDLAVVIVGDGAGN